MSSYRNETRRKDSYERYHTNSNQVGKYRSNKEFRYNRQLSQPTSYFPRTDYVESRQQNEIKLRPPDESKWNDQRYSKPSNSRNTVLDDHTALSKEGPGIGPNCKDLLYPGQDLNRSNWLSMKRSHSGSSEWERYTKKTKKEYQEIPSSSEQKAEQPVVRSWLQSFEQRKSDSPPPSHRKPELKQYKNRSKADKHKNPLDDSSLYALQKAQALLKAQLAADSTEDALPLPYMAPFGSSKIVYMLDSEERIQYSIKSDHLSATSLGDAKALGEHSSDDSKNRGLLMSQIQSRSHTANSLPTPWAKMTKSPESDYSEPETCLKSRKSKTDRSMSHEKIKKEFEQSPKEYKVQTDTKAETCGSRYLATAVSSFEEKASDFVKMQIPDVSRESLTIRQKAMSRSSSSSSSSSLKEKPHQYSNTISDKPASGSHSRSGSESPSQLRAALLEQRRKKIEAERKNNLQLFCPEKMAEKLNAYEFNKLDAEQKDVAVLSLSSQNTSNIKYSCRGKQTSKSSSSSPEPPPVIPRVHLSRFDVLSTNKVPVDLGSTTDAVLKTSNERHTIAPAVSSTYPSQLLPGESSPAGAISNQNPALSTQARSKSVTEKHAPSSHAWQLLSGELHSAGSASNQELDFAPTQSQSKMITDEYAPSAYPWQPFPGMPHPPKTQLNQQPDLSPAQQRNRSIIEDSAENVKYIPVPSDQFRPPSKPYPLSFLSFPKTTTSLSRTALSSETSLSRTALSSELPTSTSISAVIKQPLSLLTNKDHIQLSSAPPPRETCTHSATDIISVNKATSTDEFNTKGEKLFSYQKLLDYTSRTQKGNEQLFSKFNINTLDSIQSFSPSMDRKKVFATMEAASIDRSDEKDTQKRDYHAQTVREGDTNIDKEMSQNITPVENTNQTETFKEGRFKRISNRNFEKKNRFNESDSSRCNRASSSSSRDRRSRNRSKSTEKKYHKNSNSPARQRSHSQRHGRSSPAGRASSHSQRWQSPPRSMHQQWTSQRKTLSHSTVNLKWLLPSAKVTRQLWSSWKSHGVNRYDKSPPRRRSRSHERHRHRDKRRTKSRSKSRSSNRSKRLSSTSSSD